MRRGPEKPRLTDVRARYQALLAAGELKADAAQAGVVAHLAALETLLVQPGAAPGLFGRMFGKAPPPAPMGLYIWGGVGRGRAEGPVRLLGTMMVASTVGS